MNTDEFWTHVQKGDGCWEWTGSRLTQGGYGCCRMDGRTQRAHRISWTLLVGPIPAGVEVCHRCDNPPCVRPDHLFLGTHAENMRDMRAKGRVAHGERHSQAKLTNEAALEFRRRYAAGERVPALAAEFGVGWRTGYKIVDGTSYQYVGACGWLDDEPCERPIASAGLCRTHLAHRARVMA